MSGQTVSFETSAGVCSVFYPIQPLVSVIFGILFLHEKITISFLVGCAFIVFGVLLCILRISVKGRNNEGFSQGEYN